MEPRVRCKKRPRRGGKVKPRMMSKREAHANEVVRLEGLIARLKSAPTMHGDTWRDHQVAYFQKLLEALKANAPR